MVKNINDLGFLVFGCGIIPALWILHGRGVIALPEIVLGATITLESLIVQFFYRKRKEETH